MIILYEDESITVAVKPPNAVSEQTPAGDGFADEMAKRNPNGYVGVIHRLDRGVGGVMVYARTPKAAAVMSDHVRTHAFQKEYLALVHGVPQQESGTLRDLLFHDRMRNKTFVAERARKGVKEAVLDYRVLKTRESEEYGVHSLLAIRLHTGRTHQIRVQLSHRGHPLLGDGKYGGRDRCPIGLFCSEISFPHPVTGKRRTFSHEWDRV